MPQPSLSASATVFTAPSWEDVGAQAPVQFVNGPLAPQPDDMDPTHPGSTAAVIEGKTNILFVAEGFPATVEGRFRNDIVKTIVETQLLGSGNLQPFMLLKDAINYWSVFVPSREEGIAVLDDQELLLPGGPPPRPGFEVPLADPPPANATEWTPWQMAHEGGLPLPTDPAIADPQAWAKSRSSKSTICRAICRMIRPSHSPMSTSGMI